MRLDFIYMQKEYNVKFRIRRKEIQWIGSTPKFISTTA